MMYNISYTTYMYIIYNLFPCVHPGDPRGGKIQSGSSLQRELLFTWPMWTPSFLHIRLLEEGERLLVMRSEPFVFP